MSTLDELALKHGTDKSSLCHHYTRVYESYLELRREHVGCVLEIGVWRGCSLRMWADYFPHARIIGLDVSAADLPADLDHRVEFHLTDGTKLPLQFEQTTFDLIVDDGSHQSRDIINSFEAWFPRVKPGGVYVIEDLHAVYWPEYNVGCEPAAAMNFYQSHDRRSQLPRAIPLRESGARHRIRGAWTGIRCGVHSLSQMSDRGRQAVRGVDEFRTLLSARLVIRRQPIPVPTGTG